MLKCQPPPPPPCPRLQGLAVHAPLAGKGERLSGEASSPMTAFPLLARTVVDDPQGLFKKQREEELEERRKLYRLASPLPPDSS